MTRRAPNEGSVFRRADGRWVASVSLGRAGGRRVRRKRVCATQREAQAALRQLRETYAQGAPRERRRLRELAEDWLSQHVRPNLRASTVRGYTTALKLHILPTLGHLEIRAVTPEVLRAWLGRLHADGVGPRARQFAHAVLARLLAEVVRWGYLPSSPMARVPAPRHDRAEIAVWSPAQVTAALRALEGHPLRPLVVLAVTTGLRQGEALGLSWDDVDLEAGHLDVRRQLLRGEGRTADGPLKTRSAARRVALPPLAVEALRRQRQALVDAGHELDRVFQAQGGGPLPASTLHRWWAEARVSLPVPPVRWHALRHAQASLLLASGINARVIQQRLGHADVSVTLRTYAHLLGQGREERGAADAVEAALREPPGSPERAVGRGHPVRGGPRRGRKSRE